MLTLGPVPRVALGVTTRGTTGTGSTAIIDLWETEGLSEMLLEDFQDLGQF